MAYTSSAAADRQARYWRRVRRLTLSLLAAWGTCSFCVLFFARELSGLSLFGWPFSFYMAAQGLSLGYLLLIGIHVAVMKRLDRMLAERNEHGG